MDDLGRKTIVQFSDGNCNCCGTDLEAAGVFLVDTQEQRIHSIGDRKYIIGEKALHALKSSKILFTIIGDAKQ